MDYETFLALFDEMRECKDKRIGEYILEYVYFDNIMMNHPPEEHIYYIKDNDSINATIGDDYIVVEKGYGDSYSNGSKIKDFNTITEYLDYLYDIWEEKNKEKLEKELIDLEIGKRKKDKLNKFLR